MNVNQMGAEANVERTKFCEMNESTKEVNDYYRYWIIIISN